MTFNVYELIVLFNVKFLVSECNLEREKMKMRGEKFDIFFDVCDIDDRLMCIRELYCRDYSYDWVI